jgi:hypothetical protein
MDAAQPLYTKILIKQLGYLTNNRIKVLRHITSI